MSRDTRGTTEDDLSLRFVCNCSSVFIHYRRDALRRTILHDESSRDTNSEGIVCQIQLMAIQVNGKRIVFKNGKAWAIIDISDKPYRSGLGIRAPVIRCLKSSEDGFIGTALSDFDNPIFRRTRTAGFCRIRQLRVVVTSNSNSPLGHGHHGSNQDAGQNSRDRTCEKTALPFISHFHHFPIRPFPFPVLLPPIVREGVY